MAPKCLRGYAALVAILLSSCAIHAQPIVTNSIKIIASTDGVTPSGIDIPTNATMANTGAWRVHGEQNKENATIDSYGGSVFPGIYVTHSGGTEASPAAVPASQNLAIFAGGGWDGAAYQRARARITFINGAASVWTTGSTPTEIDFWTTDSGGTTPTVRWKILSSGDLLPNGSGAYRIGYLTSRVSEFHGVDTYLSGGMNFINGATTATMYNSGSSTVDFIGTAFRPTTANVGYMGDATKPWGEVNTNLLQVNAINSTNPSAGLTLSSQTTMGAKLISRDIAPDGNLTRGLGDITHNYAVGWIDTVIAGTQVTSPTVNASTVFKAAGTAGITGATCSSFKFGICIAP